MVRIDFKHKIGQVVGKCACGCGRDIIFKKHNRYLGLSRYIDHHHPCWKKGKTKYTHTSINKLAERMKGNRRGEGIKRIVGRKYCETCGEELERKKIMRGMKFCSRKCSSKVNSVKFIKRVNKKCLNCGKKYNVIPFQDKSKFCTHKCFIGYYKRTGLYKKIFNIESFKLQKRELRARQIFPKKDTSIEVKVQNLLTYLHLEFVTHKYISEITHAYQCDIFIPVQEGITQKTIIECDGCFFHACPICKEKEYYWTRERKEIDRMRTRELQEQGFRVLRFWEHEIKKMTLDDLRTKLLNKNLSIQLVLNG
jgi:G:T-mismatch repair DNA endonuclease (very short patch repair protein)/endogenous inhibitor of DNA gyrase (YacG/DUF329 family)